MHIPTLDGEFIWPHYNLLSKYNLAHYRPFFGPFNNRLTLLRTAAMDSWGSEATLTVPSLRQAADRDFVRLLETDRSLQALYLGSVELRPTSSTPAMGSAAMLDQSRVANATSVVGDGATLSISTSGGASLRVADGSWDPEMTHILSFRISAKNVATDQRDNDGVPVEVAFAGELAIPYARNTIILPKDGREISFDLLQLYSYALNPSVRDLTLHFPRAGDYTITDVRLRR